MSFSIPTLRGFINKINQVEGGEGGIAPEAPIFSLTVGCYGLYGTISTATEGATIRWTNDGSDPTCSTGNEIACSTATIVPTNQTPGSCEDIIEITASPSSTTIKAIACLAGVASSITSDTFNFNCPVSISAPSISASCPNGQGGFGCLNGVIQFTITDTSAECVDIRYTISEGSPPADPTLSDGGVLGGGTVTYNGTTVGNGVPVYIKAKAFSTNAFCSTESSVTSYSFGYQYP